MTAKETSRLSQTTVMIAAGMHVMLPLSTDIYLAAIPAIGRDFNVGIAGVQRTMVAFTIGLGLAHLAIGGLADHFGRKPVALGGLSIYLLASLACIFAPSLDLLITARFIQGMAAACGPILMRAIIRDCIDPQEAPKAFGRVGSIAGFGPVAAPLIGALAALAGGWRMSLAVLFVYGLFIVTMILWKLDETLPPEKRAASVFGNPFSSLSILLASKDFRIGMAVMGFGYGTLFSWLSIGPYILQVDFGYTTGETAICFGIWSTGFLLGNILCTRLSQRFGPGMLLSVASGMAILCLMLALFLFSRAVPPLWLALVLFYPFYLSWGFTQVVAMAVAMRPFSAIAGQASAWFGLLQQLGGASIALTAAALGGGMTTLAVMICGFTVVFMIALILRRQETA